MPVCVLFPGSFLLILLHRAVPSLLNGEAIVPNTFTAVIFLTGFVMFLLLTIPISLPSDLESEPLTFYCRAVSLRFDHSVSQRRQPSNLGFPQVTEVLKASSPDM